MQRSGDALVLSAAAHGEADTLVTLFCPEHGKIRGLMKGRKRAALLQPLDSVRYVHTRRVASQLGNLSLEVSVSRAHFWLGTDTLGTLAVGWLQEVVSAVTSDENPYPMLAEATHHLITNWPTNWAANWRAIAQYERLVLAQVGYGLRLADDPVPCPEGTPLAYVSPSSGRAVSLYVGEPYAERMLTLPAFWGGAESSESSDAYHALTLTGFFLHKATHGAKLPARTRLWGAVMKELEHDFTAGVGHAARG